MSSRELRNFTEMMRSLGYPRLISMENFRTPNFELVADCLNWLCLRYDPSFDLLYEVTTEADRVFFLKTATQHMLAKARIKLNPKKLYAADGYAVKELLKLASVLYEATTKAGTDENEVEGELVFSAGKALDVKVTRALASEITQRGAALYDSLEKEAELRELRQRAIARNMDMEEIERAVRQAISQVAENVVGTDRMLENLATDEQHLKAKIDKRKAELERSEKRLSTLQSVRPAYMDEYERLQEELQGLYTAYLEKFRNLEWLEGQLEAHNRKEAEKVEEGDRALKRMQKRLRDEELRILRGEQQVDESKVDGETNSDEEGSLASRRDSSSAKSRSAASSAASRQQQQPAKRPNGAVGANALRREPPGGPKPGGGSLGAKAGAAVAGGAVVGSMLGPDGEESDLDEDQSEGQHDSGSESTHVSLNGDESSGDDLIEDDDEDLSDDDDIGDDDGEDDEGSDNEF